MKRLLLSPIVRPVIVLLMATAALLGKPRAASAWGLCASFCEPNCPSGNIYLICQTYSGEYTCGMGATCGYIFGDDCGLATIQCYDGRES